MNKFCAHLIFALKNIQFSFTRTSNFPFNFHRARFLDPHAREERVLQEERLEVADLDGLLRRVHLLGRVTLAVSSGHRLGRASFFQLTSLPSLFL